MKKILLIEDDKTISLSISYLLRQDGFNVFTSFNIEESKNLLQKDSDFILILLDLSLPDGDGYKLISYIKNNYNIPIIVITVKDEEGNIVDCIDSGADDYITKPFKTKELISRINNIIRRYQGNINKIISYLDIKIDLKKFKVFKKDKLVNLTSLEYKLLLFLFKNKKIVLTREQILYNIWDLKSYYINDNTLTVYIKRIRNKIEDDINNPKIIKTIKGIGYKVGD